MKEAKTLVGHFTPTNKMVARQKLGLPQNKKLVAFSIDDSSSWSNGGDILQAAVEHLRVAGQIADVEAVFCGTNNANRLELGIPVHIMDNISDEAHQSLIYAAADVFAFPACENHVALVVEKSLLSGTPAVTFSVGNAPEMIRHKETGFIAKHEDSKTFAEGLAWALAGVDRKETLMRSMFCHMHARRIIEGNPDALAISKPPTRLDIAPATADGVAPTKTSPLATLQALTPPAVTEAADRLSYWDISGVVFDEHEIKGTVSAKTVCGDFDSTLPLPNVIAFSGGEAVAIAPVRAEGDELRFCLELPRPFLFDIPDANIQLRIGFSSVSTEAIDVVLPQRRLVSAERLLEFDRNYLNSSRRKPFGIVLYSFTRTEGAMLVLESLKRQGALQYVEIWMDGDQGKGETKKKLESAEAQFRAFGVERVTRHRGNLGFRKLILQSLMYMADTYDRFIVLEDDCFPSRNALDEFVRSLDDHAENPQVLTTYGHHFLVPAELPVCPRFQGWGWATWADKIKPFLSELAYLYSLNEKTYTDWTIAQMTPEILARLDCTAPRGASITLQRFFAWDETLALLAALADMKHAPTSKRCIYNFGAGEDSTHFTNIEWYRKPPFNMITKSEVWDHF